jgi:nucleoside-diphosphate-sugar epimerase
MKRVLLTGGTGFIGRQAVRFLAERGFEVHLVSRKQESGRKMGIHCHQADLFDEETINDLLKKVRPTHLLHFAWYAEHGKFWDSSENLRWVAASLSLLLNFAAAGGKRFVGAGTCAEYDWTDGHCVENQTRLTAQSLYGVCKGGLREIAQKFSEQAGLSMAWGRVFHLYGPYESPARFVPSVIVPLLNGEPALCTHGQQLRDLLHVEDVASAFAALLDSEVTGPVNVASGRETPLKDAAALIAERIGRSDLLRLAARPAAADDPRRITADVKRLRDEVRWRPKYDLESGLQEAIDWWKEHGFKEAGPARRRVPS